MKQQCIKHFKQHDWMKEIIDVIAIHFEKGYILVLLHFTLIHSVIIKIYIDIDTKYTDDSIKLQLK